MDGEVLRQRLEAEIAAHSKLAIGRRYGFSATYLGRVVAGDAPISERLAEAMGYRRVVLYQPVEESHG